MSTTTQEERIETLERQVETLCNLLGLTPEAVAEGENERVRLECDYLTLSARKNLTLEGKSTDVRSDDDLTIRAGLSLQVKAGSSLSVQSKSEAKFESYSPIKIQGASIDINGSGSIAIKGSVVKLNNGGMPVARTGDLVSVSSVSTGTIANGSPTVLA